MQKTFGMGLLIPGQVGPDICLRQSAANVKFDWNLKKDALLA
jgi:hypothetical protein